MKKFKFIVISLIAIIFFTGCNKNKISNEEKIAEKKKIEESEKFRKDLRYKEELARDKISKLYIYRENKKEKTQASEIVGEFSTFDYMRVLKNSELTDESVNKSENISGDIIISNPSRKIKLSRKKEDGIYRNEEIKKISSVIINSEENLRDKALGLLLSNQVRNIETMKNPGDYQVYYTHLVKDFFEGGKLIFLATVVNQNYSYKNGIFNSESGYTSPMELRYVLDQYKNFVFDEKIETMDGAGYGPSIQKMARGDDTISGKLMFADEVKENYDSLMEELFYKAQEEDLKDFTHKLEDIPGYEKDVVYIEKGPNHIPGTIEIAKKKDYEEAKEKVGKENWTYCEGVVYHKATGIAVKGIIDYFE